MIRLLALFLLATPPSPTGIETCPAGPLFGFVPGTDRIDANTGRALDAYVRLINAPLWRSGWITVAPTVLGRLDEPALRLVERRKTMIVRRLRELGIKPGRVRFEAARSVLPGETDADAYPSTLSTPRATWEAHVSPGMMC